MGGSESVEWVDALEASFEAGLARDEEVAADDLAFSLRQDVDVRAAVARSGTAWVLAGGAAVDEIGADYVLAGALAVPSSRAFLRAAPGHPPRTSGATLLELLGRVCRSGGRVTIQSPLGSASGRLVRVGKDHVAVRNDGLETVVGLGALESVRLEGYSASRGLRG